MPDAARLLADAFHLAGQRQAERRGRQHGRGEITSLSPLIMNLLGTDLVLGQDDVELGASVLRFDASEGLAVGDVLALVEMAEGEWMAVDVGTAKTIRPVT
jgi:hypothetical protein